MGIFQLESPRCQHFLDFCLPANLADAVKEGPQSTTKITSLKQKIAQIILNYVFGI